MPQIIKHRRGSLEGLAAVTSSLAKGELVIATGSSILSPTNGDAIVFSAPENGQVQAVNKVMRGASAPPTIASSTYNGMLDGVPYYASASNVTPTLYLLKGDANEAIDLIGNIQPFSTSVDSRLDSLEASGVGSITQLNAYTASAESKFATIQSVTSSVASRLNNLESKSASVDISVSSLNSFSASQITKDSTLATYTASIDTKFTAVASSTSSLNTFTSSQETKNSTLATYTASLETKNTTLANVTASLNTYTSSNDTKWSTLGSLSGSFARTNAQNTFNANQVISGSLTVTQNLVVLGSSSITNVSSSTLNIGTNLITVAVNQPSVRFGGIAVIDSGSTGGSGSFLYDSVQDEFIFVHRGDGTNVTSSHFVLGPETYNNLGNENYLTNNRIPKGTGKEHLNDSNITDTGTLITLGSATSVTGIVTATGFSGSFEGIGSGPAFSTSVDSRLVAVESSLGGGGSIGTRVTALEAFTSSQETKNSTLATYTGSVDTKFTTLSNVTSSLLSFTSSAASRLTNLESKSASVDTSITNLNASSASQQTSINTLNTFSSSQESKFTSLATYTGSVDTKFTTLASVTASLNSSTASQQTSIDALNTFSGSQNTKNTTLANVTASLNSYTASATGRLNNLESKSASVDISLSSLNGYTSSLQQAIATNASNVTIIGDLTVQGSTVTLNTTELIVEDKIITLASGSATSLAADGSGIFIAGANASITYENETDSFTSNKAFSGSFTGSFNTPGFGTSKRVAFRNTIGTIDFVTAPTTDGDLVQWNGTDFVMSNVIDGGSF